MSSYSTDYESPPEEPTRNLVQSSTTLPAQKGCVVKESVFR